MQRQLPRVKLTYNDETHVYMLNGTRASGVSTAAKIAPDNFKLNEHDRRQVLIGAALDRNICENVAMDIENKDAINGYVEEAKHVARAYHKADRGSQMHRVLELVLLEREDELLTDQQKRDALVLKRTLDRYKLTPHDSLVEQFVCYPDQRMAGRFDAVLERNDNSLVLTDLKSGPNAVLYPQSTSVQLALYARAPMISNKINARGKTKVSIDDWREMPGRLDRTRAYVLLVEPDAEVGTFHRIDIEHGWVAAKLVLDIIQWRKKLNYGKDIALEVKPDDQVITDISIEEGFADIAARASSVKELEMLAKNARDQDAWTDHLRDILNARWKFLKQQGVA